MPRFGVRAARDVWWFFVVVLLGNTALSAYAIIRNSANEAEVSHNLKVEGAVRELLTAIIDAETACRGFVITGNDSFLTPLHEAQPRIEPLFASLTDLLKDNAQQLQILNEMRPLFDRRLELSRSLITERRRPDHDLQAVILLVESGKRTMDEIRAKIANVFGEQERLLKTHEASAKSSTFVAIAAAVIGGLLSIGTLALVNWSIRNETESRRRNQIAVRQSEERFRLVAETLPQLVYITAPDGFVEFFNQQWYEFTGISSAQSLGHGWTSPLHPDDRAQADERWKHALESGNPFEIEYRFRRADGVYRWFLGRAVAQRDGAGRIVKWFGTCTDIEDQKRLKEELENQVTSRTAELRMVVDELNAEMGERERTTESLRQSTLELERSNRELETFAYAASHDLQEPLRKIQAFGDRLGFKFAGQLGEDGADYISRMQSSAKRMRQLIEDLLNFSRVSTRHRVVDRVDLNDTLADVAADLEESVAQSGGRIEVGKMPVVKGDATQLRQLFQNLVANAIKFRRHDVPPLVNVSAKPLARMPGEPPSGEGQRATCIEVTDNGIGFEQTYSERIFQIFQRLHGRDEYAGTGIGLAIVRKIVEQHGGLIEAHGTPGAGATFRIVLPVRGRDEPAAEKRERTTIA